MKAYLVVTGAIFALIALLHLWHGIAERQQFPTHPWSFLAEALLGVVAAALAFWAWRLARAPAKT